jgi:murein DD-endopeptidase MepM/ murein hydrolase activator NlpD
MKAEHHEYNLILVSDEKSPVRRFTLTRKRIHQAMLGAGALALVTCIGLVDYVRLRIDAVDVAALRAQTVGQQDELAGLTTEVDGLKSEFAALRELERKVRVIANLPGAVAEARVPEVPTGRGGAAEGHANPGTVIPESAPTPTHPGPASAAEEGGDGPLSMNRSGDFDRAALDRLLESARSLSDAVTPNKEGLVQLVAGLEGKRHQLESTPSIWPTDGWVTSRYGNRISPFTSKPQFHGGLDIAADFGTQIIAPARGRVSFVGRKGPMGRAVIIDHGFGLKTTYAHTAKTYVARGEVVERGTPIAAVGSTGRSTGPHLHYAVEVNGRSVDPANYIFE